MHADLDTNVNTDGDFVDATCTEYYDLIEDNDEFEAAKVAAFGDDQGEGDDEDEDDDGY